MRLLLMEVADSRIIAMHFEGVPLQAMHAATDSSDLHDVDPAVAGQRIQLPRPPGRVEA
jgi:hypothetical protein